MKASVSWNTSETQETERRYTSIGFDVIDELAESNEDLEVIEFEN